MRKISKNLASLLMRLWEVKNINKEFKRADLSNDLMSSYFMRFSLLKGHSQINNLRHNLVLRSF